jgi:murein DD-endopeptidase MepM/ murein hydrolase activator NlpD
MGRGLIVFALLVTGGLTLLLGRPASSERHVVDLQPLVVSDSQVAPTIASDTLRRGEVIAQVLARQSMTPHEVVGAVGALRDFANPRLLRSGVIVEVQRTAWDRLVDVTVRVDADRVVRLSQDSMLGWVGEETELPIHVDTLVLAGAISNSLYHSVMALPAESMGQQERIERVMWGIYRPFQWSIDFGVDLRKGDTYRAVYERHVRSDGSVRFARVLAAEFVNRGKVYRAFWLESRREYFDEDGQSMKMVFLKAPVDFRRISSRFSRRRLHPKLKVYRPHLGTDYAAAVGTPAYSTADGTVARAGWWGGYGRIVEIRHVNGYRTRYAHLSFIAKGIKKGVKVRQGQLIGHVGSSGLATGPHLHYEMLRNGGHVDHRKINLPSGKAVAAGEMAEFERTRDKLSLLLSRANGTVVKRAD